MKINHTTTLIMASVISLVATASLSHATTTMDTTKGERITLSGNNYMDNENDKGATRMTSDSDSASLTTLNDFKSLKKGDRISSWCPMMNKTYVTTVRDVDSKGHVKIKQTKRGMVIKGCNVILQRQPGGKEVQSMMVCPDGKLRPVECSRI